MRGHGRIREHSPADTHGGCSTKTSVGETCTLMGMKFTTEGGAAVCVCVCVSAVADVCRCQSNGTPRPPCS